MNENKTLPSIIFFGTPDFAVASLEALIQHQYPVLAVVTSPDRPAGRGRKLQESAIKKFAAQFDLPILQPEKLKDEGFVHQLKELNADLFIIVAFRMLPESVWNMPPLGTINVHAALLPQYRGAAPINHAIINGETTTGVTTFKLQHEIDTGDLLLQKRITIDPQDDFGSLYTKLMHAGADLLICTLEKVRTNAIVPVPQKTTQVLSPAPKIFHKDCRIDWHLPAKKIYDFIRGLSPYPGAYTIIGGANYKILETEYTEQEQEITPEDIKTDHKTFLKIAAKDGWISILKIQPEGKKAMSIHDFLNGHKI